MTRLLVAVIPPRTLLYTPPDVKPNILLVVFDTARADAFEPYGAPAGASRTVEQLAATGLAHQATFSTACWTVPAHGSLFSGELPRSAGLGHIGGQEPAGYCAAMREMEADLLPRVLGDAGYATYGVSTNAWVSPKSGFDTGFETFHHLKGGRFAGITPGGLRHQARWVLEAVRARTDDGAEAVAALLDQWTGAGDGRPFFLFVNLIECHSPYLPPKPWNDLGLIDRVKTAIEARRHLNFSELWKGGVGGLDVPEDALDRMRRSYAAAIRQLDSWLARVLETLDGRGILADTEVILTSDHGENFGDGNLVGHAFSLDDRLIRVPFVASGPLDLCPPPVLSVADVPRLLARSLDLGAHPWSEGPMGGPAVAQFDAPGTPGDPRVAELLEGWGLGDEAARRLCTSFTCATDGSVKLIRRLGREELVDLERDPIEEAPVIVSGRVETDYGSRLRPLRVALDEAEAGERPKHSLDPADPDVLADTDLEQQMRLLGYL